MGKVQNDNNNIDIRDIRPAETLEARENQMIALATKVAEQQMKENTAQNAGAGNRKSDSKIFVLTWLIIY